MARAQLLVSLICSILILNSCRSLYNNIAEKMQTGLSAGLSASFEPCNNIIIDSVANTLLSPRRDSIAPSQIDITNYYNYYNCNIVPDTIKLTQVNEKTNSLYIGRTSFDSLNYKIQTFSNYNLIQNSDTSINVTVNYISAYKSSAPLKDKKDTTGYKMYLIMSIQGNKKR